MTTTGVILRFNGSNGFIPTTATYPNTVAAGDILYGSSSNVTGGLTVGSSGQILTSNGTIPVWSTVPIAVSWVEETTTSRSLVVNQGVIANNAGLITCTLPTTSALGSIIRICGKGAGLYKIAQNASQLIHLGASVTTTGTGGSLTATNRYDTIEILCTVANTEWTVLSSVGSFTVV